MPVISLETINGTPTFVAPGVDPNYGRIHGSTFDKEQKCWRFPAYPPFGLLVVNDLKKVYPNITFTPDATQQVTTLQGLPQNLLNRTLPANFKFATTPFTHQIEGLTHLFHYPRFALYWDAGTGKSKVAIDLKRCHPDKRLLILTPKVTIQNWVREVALHSNNELRAVGVIGTPEQKRSIISRYKEYDVLVASYGTGRSLGHPRLYSATLKALKTAHSLGVPMSDSGLKELVRNIRALSDPDRQLDLALAWALGSPIAHIGRWAAQEATQKPQWLRDIDYLIIVADESHNLNDPSSQQTKAAIALSKKASHRYLMSGTPTLGDPCHLYPQMKFLSPAIIPEDWLKFSDLFLVRAPWNKRIITGFKNLNILNERVQRVSIRKRKDECLDLPPRTIIDVPVTLSAEQRRLYNTLVSEMSVDLNDFFSTSNILAVQNAAVLLNKLAQVTSGFVIDSKKKADICDLCPHLIKCVDANIQPYTSRCDVVKEPPESAVNLLKENPKLDVLNDLLDTILANPASKIIIWGLYHAELDMISQLLTDKKIEYVRVDGKTGNSIQKKIDTFNTVSTCKVYLGQVATGVGITLNAATYMVYFTLGWSLGHYLQSIDRNYRAGQTEKVVVYRLIAENTVDRFKAIALNEKKDLSTLLTNKIACATCERQITCMRDNIELFDPGCMYQRNVSRTVAKARLLK